MNKLLTAMIEQDSLSAVFQALAEVCDAKSAQWAADEAWDDDTRYTLEMAWADAARKIRHAHAMTAEI
jgi:uncharacterized membrane protein YccC